MIAAALPLHTAGPYVAAAYIVFVGLILLYVAIMAGKLSRIERDLGELTELAGARRGGAAGVAGMVDVPEGEEAPSSP